MHKETHNTKTKSSTDTDKREGEPGSMSSAGLIAGKNLRGSRNEEFFAWEGAKGQSKAAADTGGAFEAEQMIQRLVRADPMALAKIYHVPDDQDTYLWQYEHLRQVMKELNILVARLDSKCTRESCVVMKATDDWVFLCAAHKAPKECCAFEY